MTAALSSPAISGGGTSLPSATTSMTSNSTNKVNRSGDALRGPPQKTIPLNLAEQEKLQTGSCSTNGSQEEDQGFENEHQDVRRAPRVEREHVHAVYDTIADHWSHTRYRAWPRVAQFLESLPPNSCIADLGMGNAKNVIAARRDCRNNIRYIFGSDISAPLVFGAREKVAGVGGEENPIGGGGGNTTKANYKGATGGSTSSGKKNRAGKKQGGDVKPVLDDGHRESSTSTPATESSSTTLSPSPATTPSPPPAQVPAAVADLAVADCVSLPLRTGFFDASICIAVLHHLSTVARRVAVLRESLRVLRPGGQFLVYAWAMEQSETGVSRHVFESQDVLVKWHHKLPGVKREEALAKIQEQTAKSADHGASSVNVADHGVIDEEKGAIVYQRYCHVYKEGELQDLFETHLSDIARIDEVYLDTGNWCVRATKI
ncbi:unnamed protein product [Amoebophrya sp. A25]|nr:unnamed protein product [Amoebophrya sp. A25]|eukprot:GSA25T00015011001.1